MTRYFNFDRTAEPLVFHFQGYSTIWANSPQRIEAQSRKVILPDNLEIVSVQTNRGVECLLLDQLDKDGIKYINPGENIRGRWKMTDKPALILDGLRQVKSEYALVLDARDVLLMGDCSDILTRFAELGKDIIFNATKANYPNVYIDKLSDRDWRGDFRYLNAGAAIGKTDALIKFYEQVLSLIDIENPLNSEQFVVRHAFAEHTDTIDFDFGCKIFQTMGNAETEQTEIDNARIY
jgi:hypothetical protein